MGKIIITCVPGLDKLAMQEIKSLIGKEPEYLHKGMLSVRGEISDVLKLNYLGKLLQRIFWQLIEGDFNNKQEIAEAIQQLPLKQIIREDQTFAADTIRHGKHEFTSTDINRMAGEAIINQYKTLTTKRLAVNLNHPDIRFTIFIRHHHFMIALDTTGTGLHMRPYRRFLHPAGLNPCLASAMVKLSDWRPDESLIDPMCGSGTICIEAALLANRIPSGRKDFPFFRFPFIKQMEMIKPMEEVDHQKLDRELKLSGADTDHKILIGARTNAEKAGISVNFFEGDATGIALNYDRIILNPPFGLRMGSFNSVEELYGRFLDNLHRYTWKSVVILTARPYLIPAELVNERINVESGKLPMSILILKK